MIAPSGCLPGMRRVFVSVDGDYYPCERVVESPNNIIGNVSQGVNAEKVMALLDRWNRANLQTCGHCWCLPTCGVGCLASAWNDGTMDPSVKARACARHRQEIHRLLVEYCGILEENPRAFDFAAQIHVS
jgi:uncharacterized protein